MRVGLPRPSLTVLLCCNIAFSEVRDSSHGLQAALAWTAVLLFVLNYTSLMPQLCFRFGLWHFAKHFCAFMRSSFHTFVFSGCPAHMYIMKRWRRGVHRWTGGEAQARSAYLMDLAKSWRCRRSQHCSPACPPPPSPTASMSSKPGCRLGAMYLKSLSYLIMCGLAESCGK